MSRKLGGDQNDRWTRATIPDLHERHEHAMPIQLPQQ